MTSQSILLWIGGFIFGFGLRGILETLRRNR